MKICLYAFKQNTFFAAIFSSRPSAEKVLHIYSVKTSSYVICHYSKRHDRKAETRVQCVCDWVCVCVYLSPFPHYKALFSKKYSNTVETSRPIELVCVGLVYMNPLGSICLLPQPPGELCISDPIKNSWSCADSSVLQRALIKKSYSHSNSHISLHYISHSKYGINLSGPSEI